LPQIGRYAIFLSIPKNKGGYRVNILKYIHTLDIPVYTHSPYTYTASLYTQKYILNIQGHPLCIVAIHIATYIIRATYTLHTYTLSLYILCQ
jgi:hypothetical protein